MRVEPHQPSLEDLYFAVRAERREQGVESGTCEHEANVHSHAYRAEAAHRARDFWIPMMLLGAFFFLVVPAFLLSIINSLGNNQAVQQVSDALKLLPQSAQNAVPANVGAETKVSYVLAVYLFAPIAVVVPLTISTAVGASTIVGERERGTGEFLAHSPADVREIYMGKLHRQSDPRLCHDRGRLRGLLPAGEHHRRPRCRRMVLPDTVVVAAHPVGTATVPGARTVARAATVGPSEEHRGGATGRRAR